jgi:hypothetical protein
MADYRVEGTSLVSWSMLVEAGSESEASEAAAQIAGRLIDLRRDHTLRDVRHEVVSNRRLVEAPALDRPHRGSAARMGDQ